MAKTTAQPVKFRIARPDDSHKSFRFQEKLRGQRSWKTRKIEELENINKLFLTGQLSFADAEKRAELVREAEYEKRDRETGRAALTMLPGNKKILDKFMAETYDKATIKRMTSRSYYGARSLLNRAVECLALVPIDGHHTAIQDRVDELYEDEHNLHKKRTMAINRLRGWLGLKLIKHLSLEKKEVVYLPYSEFKTKLKKCREPERTVAAVAFFAGLRPSEIMGLATRDIRGNGDVLAVDRQLDPDSKKTRLPKNKKTRKAFVIDEGLSWVKKCAEMATDDRVYEPSVIEQHFGMSLYCLRHSYAVYLIGKGATLDWISQSMGNSRETCERYYAGHVLSTDSIVMLRMLTKQKPPAA